MPGGIKGCVKAERRAKKSRTRPRDPLNHSEAMALLDKQAAQEAPPLMDHDYDLVLARKGADGRAELISVPGVPRSTVKAAMLRAAKRLKK